MSLQEFLAAIVVILVVFFLHYAIGNNVFSFAPAPFILAIAVAHLARHKFKLSLLLALTLELFTYFPLGIMTAIVLLPSLIQRLFKKILPDVSISFLGLLFITIILQTALAFGYEIINLLLTERITLTQISDIIPYVSIAMIIGVTTLVSMTVCVIWREIFPLNTTGTTIFTKKKFL